MRILITGAAGFVGRHAVAHLANAGHEVIAASLEGHAIDGAELLRLDIRDGHVVKRALERAQPRAILHLAAIAFVPAVQRDPRLGFETNVLGTVNLLEACREVGLDLRFVLASSAEIYGKVDTAERIRETEPPRPATLYGATKAAAELVVRGFAQEALDALVLRPFNHVGPGQDPAYVIASFARQVATLEREGGGTLRHGNLDAIRDFLDVRDVVRAYAAALTAPRGALERGEAYNVCSGRGVAIRDVVAALASRARCKVRTELDPERIRGIDVPRFVGDPTRFADATGFTPQIPLEQTLADMLDAARK
jgi:GDP-4-dehydro-6-deoxy-D-mannose reductase